MRVLPFVQRINGYDTMLCVYGTHATYAPPDSPSESLDGDRALPETIEVFYT